MSKVYITSDCHFGHVNILRYSPESRGIYKDVEEMNEGIITNINSMVTDNDILIIAGDIGFCSAGKTCDFLKRVNGQKKLVWGNHDSKFRNSSEYQMQKKLMGVIWDGDYLEFDHKFSEAKYKIVVSHFPFLTWNRAHHGAVQLHGHSHSPFERRNTQGENVRQMDIGLDGNAMFPHDMDDICSEMSRRSIHKHGHHDGTRE